MKNNVFEKIRMLREAAQKTGDLGMPMGLRLFLLLTVLVLTIILGVIAILFINGTFTAGLSESKTIVESELQHASQGISKQYEYLSIHTINLS